VTTVSWGIHYVTLLDGTESDYKELICKSSKNLACHIGENFILTLIKIQFK
jgi:hypothetical protein